FIFPDEKEIAVVTPTSVHIFNRNKEELQKEIVVSDLDADAAEKDGYPHFMLKEIHEQPSALKKMIYDRLTPDGVKLDGIKLDGKDIRKIYIAACGSAYHAGLVGKYFIERFAGLDVNVEFASEFRYRAPNLAKDCLTVIISQSGETADSLAALKEAKRQGCRTLGIVNVVSSSIAREADDVLYTRAGPEIAVATTKGYITQVAALFLLGIKFAADRGTSAPKTLQEITEALGRVPEQLSLFLDACKPTIQYIAGKYYTGSDAYFIGRGYDFTAAKEAALKLKEISYIHAEAYAAGELKHGTISLIEKNSLVIALATDESLYDKTLSNIKEVRTRGARVVGVTDTPAAIEKECDD
ncbi:MAG: isomerizing glutamine--fructose-6-phosphate transaminase, partial [Clostridiales bacterium]|nr:isomerizing glutamine--fructose-6-phosphate transaminase [Clostridiales bacterium]